ncbi:MAG TPA: isoprenylcysteine carboxylmethyltransferase family protein [Gemmatimonadales bacterium]|nr:isoprenylcysteine carboxylmethyltransferase family protein [Gemmatimonadales bacterium]
MPRPVAAALLIAAGSVPIVWVSRRALLRPSSHGFSRFFAFEAILALVVLNAPSWFAGPFAVRQLGSWSLLIVSLVLVVWGALLLRRAGRPRPAPRDSRLFGWENTAVLVTAGPYRYIRHPLYASLLFLAWGALLKRVSLATLALAVVASLALVATARAEEAENLARFGQPYRAYMSRTRRFIPFLL